MRLFHYLYPNQHYIHFGYCAINENDVSEKREFALSPRVFSKKNWNYPGKLLQNFDNEVRSYICDINDLSKSKMHVIVDDDWNFFDFSSFPYKQYLVKFIKEFLDDITKEQSDNIILFTQLSYTDCLPFREYFSNVGYNSILIEGYMWYYLDDYRITKFVNNGPLIIIDCCGNTARHIYFRNENSITVTEVYTEEIVKSVVVRKMIAMASKEYSKYFSVDISTYKVYTSGIYQNCEIAYDNIKKGSPRVSITLEKEDRKVKIFFKDSNIRVIEQQLVLNHIRSHLHLTTNRIHEIGIVLMGEGLYYDACSSVISNNELAEKITRLQPLSFPCFSKIITSSHELKVTPANIHSVRHSIKSFSSVNATTAHWKDYCDEDGVIDIREAIRQDGYTCTLQNKNSNLYSIQVKLPTEVWKSEIDKGRFTSLIRAGSSDQYSQSSLSTPLLASFYLPPSIPTSFDDLLQFQQNQLFTLSILFPSDSSTSYHEIPYYPYCWYSMKQGNSQAQQSYHQGQLVFNGQVNPQGQLSGHFYTPKANCSSYILSNRVIYKQDDWCEEFKNKQLSYHIFNQLPGFTYQNNDNSLYQDLFGNVDIASSNSVTHLGVCPAEQYPSTRPEEGIRKLLYLPSEENEICSQWSALGGDFLENSWAQCVSDMYQSEEEVDDEYAHNLFTGFIELSKHMLLYKYPLQQLHHSILFEDINLDEEEKGEDMEDADFHLVLKETDDITCLEGYTFEYTKGNSEGRLMSKKGDMVFCGEVSNKKLNGKGSWFYKSGAPCYEGSYVNNLKHGNGKFYYSNGTLMYEGEWEKDQMHGEGRLFKPVNLKYANSDIRRYLIANADKSDAISIARRFDIYSLGKTL